MSGQDGLVTILNITLNNILNTMIDTQQSPRHALSQPGQLTHRHRSPLAAVLHLICGSVDIYLSSIQLFLEQYCTPDTFSAVLKSFTRVRLF